MGLKKVIMMILVLSFLMTGCASTNANHYGALGGLTGMAVSAWTDDDPAQLGGIGAVLGYIFGQSLDIRQLQNQLEQQINYMTGHPVVW